MRKLISTILILCLVSSNAQAKINYEKLAKETAEIMVKEYLTTILKELTQKKAEEIAKKYIEQATLNHITNLSKNIGGLLSIKSFLDAKTDKEKGYITANFILGPDPISSMVLLGIQLADSYLSAVHEKNMMEFQLLINNEIEKNYQLDILNLNYFAEIFSLESYKLVRSKNVIDANITTYSEKCYIVAENQLSACRSLAVSLLSAIESYKLSKDKLMLLMSAKENESFKESYKVFYSTDLDFKINNLRSEIIFFLEDSKSEILDLAISSKIKTLRELGNTKSMGLIIKSQCINNLIIFNENYPFQFDRELLAKCEVVNE